MRSALFAAAFFALFSPPMLHAQAGKKADVEVFGAVLKTAEWAGFKYMENVNLAKGGDQKAIKALLEFSGTVDGTEAIQHTTTCLELIPFASDEKVGSTIYIVKPRLKALLLDRFQLAQGRTKKEVLRKPLQEWAPLTWKALHGEKVVCGSCMHEMGTTLAKPGGSQKPGAATMQTAEPSDATGKQ
ncbi:MAG: hypothetical protein ACKVUS_10840 [Saprospiraceae bacterium]